MHLVVVSLPVVLHPNSAAFELNSQSTELACLHVLKITTCSFSFL